MVVPSKYAEATKENDGAGRVRRDLPKRFGLILLIICIYYFIPLPLSIDNIEKDQLVFDQVDSIRINEDVEPVYDLKEKKAENKEASEEMFQSRPIPKRKSKHFFGASQTIKVQPDSAEEEMILAGLATLVDVRPSVADLTSGNDDDSYKAKAFFCEIKWSLHKNDPASHAMFKSLLSESDRCQQQQYEVDMQYITEKARDIEKSRNNTGVKSLKPNGFVFHESRCGSTLVANSLASFNPQKTRVFSESPPPINAFRACDGYSSICNRNKHEKLIQDVIFMMGWTGNTDEEFLFFKIQSIGTKNINAFRRALPDVPWIFVFRDPVQVIMSHLKGYPNNPNALKRANCLRTFNRPPKDTMNLAKRITGVNNPKLSKLEFCAAHLVRRIFFSKVISF